MGLRVNTNILSLAAQRQLSDVTGRLSKNFERLASGTRITSAADDPAGLGISERMGARLRSLSQASRNSRDGISLIQTAEGALGEATNNLSRMRELAVQASNGTLTSQDRTNLNNEFQDLISEIDRVADTTSFNGVNLLDNSSSTIDIQVGVDAGETVTISLVDATESGLGLDGGSFDLTTVTNAQNALTVIDTAIDSVTTARAGLGASENALASTGRSIAVAIESLAASQSRIRDVDVAQETADLARNSILQQQALAVLAQANVQPAAALSLLQG